ncbi:MAG: hypothetical protein LBI05_01845 [Planctomycetaceae bacterium]|jgi:hypothetical protein|nr:hypothetical protein [Planctomycetaceae bacterium]
MTRLFLTILCFFTAATLKAATLMIGTAQGDITPTKSVPLQGQFDLRLSQGIDTPLAAHVVALEFIDNNKQRDIAIFVSVDASFITHDLLTAIREKTTAASIDASKLIVSATHTHTAPVFILDSPKLPIADTIADFPESIDFTAQRIADAVNRAWQNRKPGKIAFGLDFGVVGWSRRTTYADGSSAMFGNTNQPDFRGIEAMEDHDIGSIFFLDEHHKILAVAVNVACPSQVVGGRNTINADFWHPVRETLAARFGKDLVVLGWCSAAGDNGPHPTYRQAAIARMNTLRELDEMQEIARKIDRAVADTWEAVKTTATGDVPLIHRVETLQLPMRKVTEQEYQTAKVECDKVAALLRTNTDKAPAEVDWMAGDWHGGVVKRYEMQQKDPDVRFAAEVHVVRLGETAIFTNPFELFTDYGIQMKARSPAVQTFLVQLAGVIPSAGGYLPTERAVRGGGYSAIIHSTPVSPEGGQMLVDETLKMVGGMFGR